MIPTSRDAAFLVTLAPGTYNLRLSATPFATGVALIDIHEVPWRLNAAKKFSSIVILLPPSPSDRR